MAIINSDLVNVKTGTFTGTTLQYVQCGYRPTNINILVPYSNGSHRIILYNANYKKTCFLVNESETAMPNSKDDINASARLYIDDGFYFLPWQDAFYYVSK